MTNMGDIEKGEWATLARNLVDKYNESDLFNQLMQWYTDMIPFIGRQKQHERESYVLQLHMSRIFDHKDWVDYIPFNAKYRPNILKIAVSKFKEEMT